MTVLNALSFDVEEWYNRNDVVIPGYAVDSVRGRVVSNTEKVLELLAESDTKATFFIIGKLAEEFPDLVKIIDDAKHEIACHSWNHSLVYKQDRLSFKTDTERAKKLLEDQSGKAVKGFRAPSWSISKDCLWAFDVLKELDFKYDSSVMPVKFGLFGIPGSNPFLHKLDNGLMEFPPPTFEFMGNRYPFAGTTMLRIIPYTVGKFFLKKHNKLGYPGMVYLHPWELDIKFKLPDFPDKVKVRMKHYGISFVEKRLKAYLRDFDFSTVYKLISQYKDCNER